MLLGYIDESQSSTKYHVAGLILTAEGARDLTEALDQVVAGAMMDFGVDSTAELHGHDLYRGKSDWKPMASNVRGRISVYGKALDVIADHAEGFYIRSVHLARFKERYGQRGYHPHTALMMMLMEEFEGHCEPQDQLMLCVADECGQQAVVRSDLREFRKKGTWGYKSQRITRILDTFHFAPSHESRLIQAVDMIAFIYQRQHDHYGGDPRSVAATAQLWEKVAHRHLRPRGTWYP